MHIKLQVIGNNMNKVYIHINNHNKISNEQLLSIAIRETSRGQGVTRASDHSTLVHRTGTSHMLGKSLLSWSSQSKEARQEMSSWIPHNHGRNTQPVCTQEEGASKVGSVRKTPDFVLKNTWKSGSDSGTPPCLREQDVRRSISKRKLDVMWKRECSGNSW